MRTEGTAAASHLWMALLAVLVFAAPAAQAQPPLATYSLSLLIEAAADPIEPLAETAQAHVFVDVTCQPNSVRTQSAPLVVTINVSADDENAAVAWMPHRQEVDFDRQQCLEGHTVSIPVQVNISLGAGLLAGDSVAFTAVAAVASEGVEESAGWTQSAAMRVDYGARLDQSSWRSKVGDTVTLAGTFDNGGNTPLSVAFVAGDASSDRLQLGLPATLTSSPYSATAFEVQITVGGSKPRSDREETFTFVAQPSAVDDPSAGLDPVPLSGKMVIEGTGAGKDSPPPGLALALVALAALARRLRH